MHHYGEYGELTITTLGVEGMPLLRFKTGDIARFHYEPCKCGRTSMRISPIKGRKNQMIKYKGTTLYPAAIFDVIENIDYIENYVVILSDNELGTDDLTIIVGNDNPKDSMVKDIKDCFRAKLRVAPNVQVETVELVKNLQNVEVNRKPVKFINNKRNNNEKNYSF